MNRDLYLQQQLKGKVSKTLPAAVAAYTRTHWILDSKRELSGYGFLCMHRRNPKHLCRQEAKCSVSGNHSFAIFCVYLSGKVLHGFA